MRPLFMWAGGKTKMIKKYKPYLPTYFSSYHEPFLGGGAMFIWAYKENPTSSFYLNDCNKGIMQVYKSVKNDLPKFIQILDTLSGKYLPLSKSKRKSFYYKIREEHAFDFEKWDATEEAAHLYFLMKTGFNGLWQINKNTNNRFGTACGLLNQTDKVYDKENVLAWHKALQKATLTNKDYMETLDAVGEDSFVFLDPPYRGCFTNYGTQVEDSFQKSVVEYAENCKNKKAIAFLCNRETGDGFFTELQGSNQLYKLDVTYTLGRRKKTEEGFKAKQATEILLIADGRTPYF